jgi:signal transduction histidine kinase
MKIQMEDRQLEVAIAPMPPIDPIYADPQRLYDALMHVASNSIKFTPDGGHIQLAAHVIKLNERDEKVVEIIVADDGIGIAADKHERIFEKFFGPADSMHHSSSRTKFKGGGPGLGLAIAKGIIDAHGGKIWAESPGYDEVKRPGTTIHILLPMHVQSPEVRGRHRLGLDENA